MKFSYPLIKKFLPELKSKQQLVETLNLYAFETEKGTGSIFDVSVPPNRYSDVASHIGIAREAASILNLKKTRIPNFKVWKQKNTQPKNFKLEVKNTTLCPRYTAQFFDNIRVKPSPRWLKNVLLDCGLKPINNVVDVMNYVMLETGQPLHAFDSRKVEGRNVPTILVRKARQGESITSIDGDNYVLTPDTLVIADAKKPVAIAGIKGGKDTEVTEETTSIIVESANFDPVSIYKTSRALSLVTDASLRFSHQLHQQLAAIGLERARQLLKEIVGARPVERFDSSPQKPVIRKITFNIDWFNRFIGTTLNAKETASLLHRLGFKIQGTKVEVPMLRCDIERKEDIAEEVARLVGYDTLISQSPVVGLTPSEFDEYFQLKDSVQNILTGLGFNEVYNSSFVGERKAGELELENPITEDKKYLRPSLLPLLKKNITSNLRFYDEVRIFEMGKVFTKTKEKNTLGIAVAAKNRDLFFELKGALEQLLKGLGLTDFGMIELKKEEGLRIESDHSVVGLLIRRDEHTSFAELDMEILLNLIQGELSYTPLPKYPAVMRDISILINADVRIGKIIQEIQLSNVRLIQDVDLIDEYIKDAKQSITVRVVFRADNRTLGAEEVDKEMKKINLLLERKFGAEVR